MPLSGNELCTGATVRVPAERFTNATYGTRAIRSPPLRYPLSYSNRISLLSFIYKN